MNFQPLRSLFTRRSKRVKKTSRRQVDKWYEYSSMNDLYNPTLTRISKLRTMDNDPTKVGNS